MSILRTKRLQESKFALWHDRGLTPTDIPKKSLRPQYAEWLADRDEPVIIKEQKADRKRNATVARKTKKRKGFWS